MKLAMLFAPLLLLAAPVSAQELRELCADRPGLGTPTCIVDRGHFQLEAGLLDWTHDRQPDAVEDDVAAGDLLLRYGLDTRTELRLGWTAYGHARVRDRLTGAVQRSGGVGDVTLGLRRNLANPDGSGFSAAVLPFVGLPVGGRTIGAGTWNAGLVVPVSYELSDKVQLQFTPEIDAAPDEDRHGRHLAYSGVIGLGYGFTDALSGTVELAAQRDRDPGGHETATLAGVSFAYQLGDRVQLDVGGNAGLNHNAPDVELYFGVARKF